MSTPLPGERDRNFIACFNTKVAQEVVLNFDQEGQKPDPDAFEKYRDTPPMSIASFAVRVPFVPSR